MSSYSYDIFIFILLYDIDFKCFQEPVIQNGTDGSSTSCACMTGYQHDQSSGDCVDINECELGTHKCVDNICFNLGSFSNSKIF